MLIRSITFNMLNQLLLLTDLMSLVSGCSCEGISQEPKDKYCGSDFAALAKIMTVGAVEDDKIMYMFSAEKVYKDTKQLIGGIPIALASTSSREEDCGLPNLQNNTQYLLNGSVKHLARELPFKYLELTSCTALSAQKWDDIPDDIRRAVEDRTYEPCSKMGIMSRALKF
uniref:NTR domain-containing protein n=1 Tax=Steinernema glaseri TaxID=37863 RepID=A0A1I8AL64_9BILA